MPLRGGVWRVLLFQNTIITAPTPKFTSPNRVWLTDVLGGRWTRNAFSATSGLSFAGFFFFTMVAEGRKHAQTLRRSPLRQRR